MIVTDKLLKEAGEMARLLFTDEELAIILEIPPAQMAVIMSNPDHELAKCIHKHRLLESAEIRQCILDQAKRGSSTAQTQATQFLNRLG